MPGAKRTRRATSVAQQQLMGADLSRARAGKSTETGMNKRQLKEFASTPHAGLPRRVKSRGR